MSLPLLITLTSEIVGMIGCYLLFKFRGRSPRAGLVVGFLFGVLGLIVATQLLRDRNSARPRSFRLSR
jgi:thiamine transporter ThiT